MVTSAGSGDGKTTTVANLAAAYGESGLKVLVLSFDLKRIRFGRSTCHGRAPGVNDYLVDPAAHPLETLVRDAKVPGVGVVGNGVPAARPAASSPYSASCSTRPGPGRHRAPRHVRPARLEHQPGAGDDGRRRGRHLPRRSDDRRRGGSAAATSSPSSARPPSAS